MKQATQTSSIMATIQMENKCHLTNIDHQKYVKFIVHMWTGIHSKWYWTILLV